MMAFARACFDPSRQGETKSGGQTPGIPAHLPCPPRGGCLGHVLRPGAWAERRAGSLLFFASALRTNFLWRDLRGGEYVLPSAPPVGRGQGGSGLGLRQVARSDIGPWLVPAAALLLS